MHDLFLNGNFLDYEELSNRFPRYPRLVFDYNAVMNAIPDNWKVKLRNIDNIGLLIQKKDYREDSFINLNNHELRKLILANKPNTRCNENFWRRKLKFDVSKHYNIAHKATKESRLRLLHFKIMHNIYPTNILLCKMKVRSNTLCDNCHVTDFIEHFFVECHTIKGFWTFISSFIESVIDIHVNLGTKDILLGLIHSEHDHIKNNEIDYINAIILLGKLCVSKMRFGKIKNIYLIFDLELNLRKKFLQQEIIDNICV